jgi:hypothetical protein
MGIREKYFYKLMFALGELSFGENGKSEYYACVRNEARELLKQIKKEIEKERIKEREKHQCCGIEKEKCNKWRSVFNR